jgi:hypothetical protein
MDMNQLIAQLIGKGQEWMKEQRQVFRPLGRVLPDTAIAQFSLYFEEQLLQKIRLVTVPALENPGFIKEYQSILAEKAIPSLDFSTMAGITFVDTILLVDRFLGESATALIFHELVHAVQYEVLGLEKFVELYILGWVNQGFNYAAIPLEMDAYELQNRYEADPTQGFRVKDEVSSRLELMLDY